MLDFSPGDSRGGNCRGFSTRRRDSLSPDSPPTIAGLRSQGVAARKKPPRINVDFAIRICPRLISATVSWPYAMHPAERCDGRLGELPLRRRQPAGEQRGAGCAHNRSPTISRRRRRASRPSPNPLGVRSIFPAGRPERAASAMRPASSCLDVNVAAPETPMMSKTRQRHRRKRGLGPLLLVVAALGCAVPAFGRDDPIKTMISAEHDLDVMCRGGSPEEFTTVEACKSRDKLAKALHGKGYCFGKQGQAGADMQWHKCGSSSLRGLTP